MARDKERATATPDTSEESSKGRLGSLAKPIGFALVLVVLVVLDQVFGISARLSDESTVQAIRTLLDDHYLLAVLIYVAATILCCVFLAAPGLLFAIVAAALFGPWLGTVWCVVAATLGAMVAFLAGRYFLRDSIRPRVEKSKVLNKLLFSTAEGSPVITLATTRLVPIFPYNIQNFAYGITDMPFWLYSVGTFVFLIPGTALYAFSTASLIDANGSWEYLAIAVGLVVLTALVAWFLQRRLNSKTRKAS